VVDVADRIRVQDFREMNGRTSSRRVVVIARNGGIVCGLLLFSGCTPTGPATPPSSSSSRIKADFGSRYTGWGWYTGPSGTPATRSKKPAVPGIDYATVVYVKWNDRVALAVCVDHDKSPQSTSTQYTYPGDGKAKFRCFFEGLNSGPPVEIKWATPDGLSEPVTIGGQSFDLSRGWLFLVSRTDGKVRVKQLKRGALKVRPDIEGGPEKDLLKLKVDPDVVAFYRRKIKP
jgi:hypothetical protein